jgi:ribosomal protein S18 acetylase RimI-like enzyme
MSDLRAVAKILHEAFPDFYELKGLSGPEIERILRLRFKYEKWVNRIKQCVINRSLIFFFTDTYDRVAFVAEEEYGNKLVGVVIISHVIGDLWNLDQIAVDPNYRRQHIGERLLKKAILHVKNAGGRRIQLFVSTDNISALGLYTKLGFTNANKLNHMILDLSRYEHE